MIFEYENTLDDAKRNAKHLIDYLYRKLLLPAIITAAMGVAVLALALTVLTEERIFLYLGCMLLLLAVFILLTFVFTRILCAKNVEKSFAVYSSEGKEKFSIEYNDGVYVFTNISKGNVAKYVAADIVSVKPYRELLVLKLASKEMFICPNAPQTRQIFAQYLPTRQ